MYRKVHSAAATIDNQITRVPWRKIECVSKVHVQTITLPRRSNFFVTVHIFASLSRLFTSLKRQINKKLKLKAARDTLEHEQRSSRSMTGTLCRCTGRITRKVAATDS